MSTLKPPKIMIGQSLKECWFMIQRLFKNVKIKQKWTLYTHMICFSFLVSILKVVAMYYEPSLVVVLKNPSVYVCHTSSLTHSCHGLKYVNTLMNLYLCTFVDAWLKKFMYLFMIGEHIILIEPSSNWFDATFNFNTKTRSSKREILMNWNVQN